MATYDIVAGSNNDLQFQLLNNGTPINLEAITVTLLLEDKDGTAITSPGTVTVVDSTNGTVKLTPTSTAVFVADTGPYYARWQLQDNFGRISFVPSSVRDRWNIIGK